MIFNVRRSSYFPIILEQEEQHTMDTLEQQERWGELEQFERDLRNSDALKDLKVEAEKLEEILVFLNSINHMGSIRINFQKHEIIIEDNGDSIC